MQLKSFRIDGLFGYKNLSINCNNPASIILAENGIGKTTLLNVLYALLSGKISRLAPIEFKEATIEFGETKHVFTRELAFKPKELFNKRNLLTNRTARELLNYGATPEQVIELASAYLEGGHTKITSNPNFRKIYSTSPLDKDEIIARIERFSSGYIDSNYIAEFRKGIQESLNGTEVIYLPTYRRIEASFEDVSLARNTSRSRFAASEDNEKDELIFFGLADVEDKLASMTQFIQRSVIEAYSRLSGSLIDTLLNPHQYELTLDQQIDPEAVRLMLGRLGKTSTTTEQNIEYAMGSEGVTDERSRILSYFLRELLRSYEKSLPQELAIEAFADVVNGYLLGGEFPEKSIRFDKIRLKVEIWHEALQKSLPFASLSSGEKQIVSVFARLLLDLDRHYLILIDEPELSLSIEWQRRFLPDILKAASCDQLIAITHSPFVFENDLDHLAQSISISQSREN